MELGSADTPRRLDADRRQECARSTLTDSGRFSGPHFCPFTTSRWSQLQPQAQAHRNLALSHAQTSSRGTSPRHPWIHRCIALHRLHPRRWQARGVEPTDHEADSRAQAASVMPMSLWLLPLRLPCPMEPHAASGRLRCDGVQKVEHYVAASTTVGHDLAVCILGGSSSQVGVPVELRGRASCNLPVTMWRRGSRGSKIHRRLSRGIKDV